MEYKELEDLKYIKKHYGEKMSHLCRDLFSSILECPGLLYHLISTHFYQSKSLYYDIVNEQKEESFKNYIYSFYNTKLELPKLIFFDYNFLRDNESLTDINVSSYIESQGVLERIIKYYKN